MTNVRRVLTRPKTFTRYLERERKNENSKTTKCKEEEEVKEEEVKK